MTQTPQNEENTWFTRFPPSQAALEICQQSVQEWQKELDILLDLEETTWKMAARVNSWIGPKSVEAGVRDLVGPKVRTLDIPDQALTNLSDNMARRLLEKDLLGRPIKAKAVQRPDEQD